MRYSPIPVRTSAGSGTALTVEAYSLKYSALYLCCHRCSNEQTSCDKLLDNPVNINGFLLTFQLQKSPRFYLKVLLKVNESCVSN